METNKPLTIQFGALAPPLVDQLMACGVEKIPAAINHYQRLADALIVLRTSKIISETETHKARVRITKKLERIVRL